MAKTEREKMLAGELYLASDPELVAAQARAQELLAAFNGAAPGAEAERRAILRDLLGEIGEGVVIKPSLRCDYGTQIRIGARTFINYDAVMLDCAAIEIGADVQIAPGVHLYTATHPLDGPLRRSGAEFALPIRIGDGVWLGGGVIVCPGVTIGANTVVGAGAVVTKDLPANCVAAGNPCRVLRFLGEDGRDPGAA